MKIDYFLKIKNKNKKEKEKRKKKEKKEKKKNEEYLINPVFLAKKNKINIFCLDSLSNSPGYEYMLVLKVLK